MVTFYSEDSLFKIKKNDAGLVWNGVSMNALKIMPCTKKLRIQDNDIYQTLK